ncbi:hypothetical protein FACS189419_09290 [Planctomycetales bacterium]|nr:hypothetical protein FACS189419_09290 [Planctomycetales bacterium]
MFTTIRFIIVLVLSATFTLDCLFADEIPSRSNYDAFAALPPEKQKEELIKLFKERVEKSQNMYYHLEETTRFRKKENGKEGAYLEGDGYGQGRTDCTHWLCDNSYRMKMERYHPGSDTPNEWLDSMYDGGEGVNRVTALLIEPKKRIFGRIDTQQDPPVLNTYYWRVLTDKFHNKNSVDSSVLLAKNSYLFPHFIENQKSLQVTLLPEQGKVQAEVDYIADYSFEECAGKRTFILDPEKGFLPVSSLCRYDGIYLRGSKTWREEKLIVEEAKLVSGIWMPIRLTFTTSADPVPEQFAEIEINVKDISFGTVTKKDVELQFPEGTEVVDAIEGIAYKTDANGKPIEATIEPLYGFDPKGVAEIPEKKYPVANYIFIGAGLLLIGVALYLIYKERKGK